MAIQDFFSSSQMVRQINHSFTTLVPKSHDVTNMVNVRLISCCNVTYKLIFKILANRLTQDLKGINILNQNGFHLAQEMLRHYGKNGTSFKCLAKIDFRKAFDSIQ